MSLLTDHSNAQEVYIQHSVTLISITFLVVTIDCYYQCFMILIVGMCMGFNMILNFFVTILCFALKHKSDACIVTILYACEKTLPIRFMATDCLKLCMYSHGT